ncbi:helix-turn-helix domain-containing protein [Actinoplanes aureus]|uniref:Helix-turn-helix domain-containing protein n=1 Tax=Actinoplanes aureus TaxID=2792083 RepID=A0A931C8I3_9ACTN|nr:helix-turn-helix domain-containing protein [Actinoplanes aureus]MBG0561423.1 helix-turn-helix domain-containing protein [Actinoplanes aureus]
MKDLAVRLAALDPDAGAALRVIAYFDRLTEGRAGLQAIVRGAAVLAGCPARLADDGRRIQLRVQPDGTDATARPPDPSWMSAAVADGAVLWLERPGPPGPVEAMILERASGAARAVLERTRRLAPPTDPASVELTLDGTAPEAQRLAAAARLGLEPTDPVRAIALADGAALLLPGSADGDPSVGAGSPGPSTGPAWIGAALPANDGRHGAALPANDGRHGAALPANDGRHGVVLPANDERHGVVLPGADGRHADPRQRAGIGPAGPVAALPASYAAARTALRFTAEGTEQDPGPRVVHADRLGGLILLADAAGPGTEPVPDVRALDRAAASAPWALATLDAVAEAVSLRAAATALRLHHSTLQERLTHTRRLLDWDIREPQGRLRLQVALALRRLHRNPPQ